MASWDLSVTVEELGLEATPFKVSVTSDLRIGGVVFRIVEKTREFPTNLLQLYWTLEKYEIHADVRLSPPPPPQHKPLTLGLPNGTTLRLQACFSSPVFQTVMGVCRLLNMRHPEELSLLRPVEEKKKKKDTEEEVVVYDLTSLRISSGPAHTLSNGKPVHFADSPQTEAVYKMLSVSLPAPEAITKMPRPTSLVDKAQVHMQEHDRLLLHFKYYCFHDLQPKVGLQHQARWAILLEDVGCTEEEMMLFAHHIGKVSLPEPRLMTSCPAMDDLDSALQCLEVKMDAEESSAEDMLETMRVAPELHDYLNIFRPKRLTLKGYKQFWFTFNNTSISYYKSKEESLTEPIQQMNLKGCEVVPDVSVAGQKFCIRLLIPGAQGMNEVYLRCENGRNSIRWMAACRLASKGKTLADSSFSNEVQNIQSFLAMQRTTPGVNAAQTDDIINTHGLVSPHYHKKYKSKQLTPRILESYQNVAQLSLTDALLRFLQIWQRKGFIAKILYSLFQVAIEFNGNVNIAFSCVTATCKIVHEYIGVYIFIAELFYKLTGGHEAL
uniref:FERM domain containing kindlin 3a n=1 Tax=Oncorhynchus mykiss TaxID=8022 RepID=A0A8C7UJ97_ONCMY